MKFNVSAFAMAAVLSAGATSSTLAFVPSSSSSSANHHHPSLAVSSSFHRPAFVAPERSGFALHMVGGGKDEEAENNLNEYKKKISSKRITEASGKSGEVRLLPE